MVIFIVHEASLLDQSAPVCRRINILHTVYWEYHSSVAYWYSCLRYSHQYATDLRYFPVHSIYIISLVFIFLAGMCVDNFT